MIDWNLIAIPGHDDERAFALLRRHGSFEHCERVVLARVDDPHALLEEALHSHAFARLAPITAKLWFGSADELERKVRPIVATWAVTLTGKTCGVHIRDGGAPGGDRAAHLQRVVYAQLARHHVDASSDPDAVIAIELVHDDAGPAAGLALWQRSDLERFGALLLGAGPAKQRATASELVGLLGEIDPITIERLLETGASIGEVAAAIASIEDEDAFGEHHDVGSAREGQVRSVLEELAFERAEERETEGELAHT